MLMMNKILRTLIKYLTMYNVQIDGQFLVQHPNGELFPSTFNKINNYKGAARTNWINCASADSPDHGYPILICMVFIYYIMLGGTTVRYLFY